MLCQQVTNFLYAQPTANQFCADTRHEGTLQTIFQTFLQTMLSIAEQILMYA
jgi:hypothetical protein